MATTTNYAWETPDDTDLVKDGAAAIRTLGSSIDTTTKALNPSTTLGDIEYRSATANTNTRLGIGSTGNVLTVSGGVPIWAAPAGGGKVLQVVSATTSTETDNSTSTYSDTGLTANITPSATSSRILVLITIPVMKTGENANNQVGLRLLRGATTLTTWAEAGLKTDTAIRNTALFGINYVDSPSSTSSLTYKLQFNNTNNTARSRICSGGDLATITLMEIGA